MIISNGWHAVRTRLEAILDAAFAIPSEQHLHFDSILSIEEITKLDYARNFPHLTCLGCGIPETRREAFSKGTQALDAAFRPEGAAFALLPATCFKLYLTLESTTLETSRYYGCIASCFRNEDKPIDSYRDLNFTMKEFVCVGTAEDARRHLEDGLDTIACILTGLGISTTVETASDPFFDTASSQAVLSKLAPTKREVVFDGNAVASANFHRNYFGEKFSISLADTAANTSCVAFGLERWISMLKEVFGRPETAMDALTGIGPDGAVTQIAREMENAG